MSNSSKKTDNHSQLNLFDIIKKQSDNDHSFSEGSLNIMSEFKRILSKCLSNSKLSAYQICARMSELLGCDITVTMMYAWTAQSHEQHRFPAEYLPAFCEAVKLYDPIKFLAQKTGLFLLPGEEALRSEIQKIEEELKRLEEEKSKRLFFLNEINRKL